MAANESINRKNRIIDIKFHYVRHVTSNGEVVLGYISKSEMVADTFNKPLGRTKFKMLCTLCVVVKGPQKNM